ncbi:MAG: hypothetical protein ACR2H5_25570 [Ktedonobacteraceae bacterium]
MGIIKCPYCALTREVPLHEVYRPIAVTGAIQIISKPLKKPTVGKMYIRFHKLMEKIRNAMKISSTVDDKKKLEIANSWIDMKCARCGNPYRYNTLTEEVHK